MLGTYVEFVVASVDAWVAFEPAEEPFDLVSSLVCLVVVVPGLAAVRLGHMTAIPRLQGQQDALLE